MSITGQNLSIVIVTLRSENVIFKCLDSINHNIPVFIIENSSNFEFKNLIEKKYNNVKCTITEKNLGMGTGNNVGIRLVKTDYVLILNPDVILEPNTLEELMKSSKNNQDFAIMSPISGNSKYPNYKLYEGDNLSEQDNLLLKVKSVDGYAMLFNKKKINEILEKEPDNKNQSYFDENFFMYLEEIDLCKRLKKINENILVSSDAKSKHRGAKSSNIGFEFEINRNWHWMWSKMYFASKYNGFFVARVALIPELIKLIVKTLFYFIFFNKKKLLIANARLCGLLASFLKLKSYFRTKLNVR